MVAGSLGSALCLEFIKSNQACGLSSHQIICKKLLVVFRLEVKRPFRRCWEELGRSLPPVVKIKVLSTRRRQELLRLLALTVHGIAFGMKSTG